MNHKTEKQKPAPNAQDWAKLLVDLYRPRGTTATIQEFRNRGTEQQPRLQVRYQVSRMGFAPEDYVLTAEFDKGYRYRYQKLSFERVTPIISGR